jgi:serine/threonine protein kinase/Tol biopolymer transport system component
VDAERWRQVEQLYHAAMELEEDPRKAFLDRECAGDQALRVELESLIAYSQQTGRIIDKPALDAVVGAIAEELRAQDGNKIDERIGARTGDNHIVEKTLAPGTKLGDYEVKSLLGLGGMGQVYRAHDRRLGRDVAIKVLPSFLSADSDRLRRFEQEARAAAALNHPNILAVFQMGTYKGAPYLVSELLEGETLREQIKRGHLLVRKAIGYGVQIAHGLAAAQEKDIVHRDLKPENLFVTKDGRVKILDFGLAKLVEPQSKSEHPEGTETGVVMGTVGYMSPEQVRGETADYRTDIFAFGVILYEMLTGKRAFQKVTSADTISAILNEDPPGISQVNRNVPPALQRVVHRCLEKNPERRFQSASDLAFALDALPETSGGAAPWPKKDPAAFPLVNFVREHKRALAGGLVLFALLLGAFQYLIRSWGSSDGHRHKITYEQYTFSGDAHAPAVSPDGLFVAYVSRKFGEQDRLMLQASNGAILELARATELDFPRWSPDGSQLLFSKYEPELHQMDHNSAEGLGISVVSRLGGVIRPIFPANYACWFAPDGSQIVGASAREHDPDFKGVRLVNTLTGEAKEVHLSEYSELWDIDCSARAGLILAVTSASGKFQIRTFEPGGSEESKLVETDDRIYSARWSPAGDSIYYLHGRGSTKELSKVFATRSNAEPVVLADGLQTGRFFTLSLDGASLAYTREDHHWNLWRVDLQAAGKRAKPEISRLTSGTSFYGKSNFSPDGRWIVFSHGANSDETNIFKMSVVSGQVIQLTFLKHAWATSPAWSPDGQRIAFISNQKGTSKVWTIGANGGTAQALERTDASKTHNHLAWWPSRDIVYEQPQNHSLLRVNDKTNEETPIIPLDRATGSIVSLVFAPDGNKMAVQWRRDEAGLWIISQEPYSETLLQSGDLYPVGWSPDGKYVYAIRRGREIVKVQVATPTDVSVVTTLPGDGSNGASLSPDGKQIVVSVSEEKSDVWLMHNFDLKTP